MKFNAPKTGGRPKTGTTGPRLRASSQPEPMLTAGQDRRIQHLTVSVPLDPYFSLKALATYSDLSVRTLRAYLDDFSHPLPHYRVGGKILIRRSEFDAWIAAYRRVGGTAVTP
jgi:excisionase family DNA binding protein